MGDFFVLLKFSDLFASENFYLFFKVPDVKINGFGGPVSDTAKIADATEDTFLRSARSSDAHAASPACAGGDGS